MEMIKTEESQNLTCNPQYEKFPVGDANLAWLLVNDAHPLLQENYNGVETTRLWNNFFLSFLAKTAKLHFTGTERDGF